MSKGSKRRPTHVNEATAKANWERIFGVRYGACDYCKVGNKPGPHHKPDCALYRESEDPRK